MDCRTEVEKKLHDIVLDALHFMEHPRGSRPQFQTLMGELRDARVMLDNKQFGCPSGRHSTTCSCSERKAA